MGSASRFNSEAYLKKARQEIVEWEGGKRGYWARFGDFALNPAAKLTAKMVPRAVEKTACQVIEKTLRLTAQAGKFSVDVQGISRKRLKRLGKKKVLGQRLKACDDLAKRYWNTHCGYAAVEGAATGVIGFAGLMADIPLILSIAIREIRTIALCYGYSAAHPPETDYALHILRLGSTNEKDIRADTLKHLRKMESVLTPAAVAKPSARTKKKKRSDGSEFFSLQEYAKSLAIELVQRRALRLLPVAGVVTAASFNAAYAHDIGRTAFMCYRRRFIEEHCRQG
jgi:hypothetical protein